MSKKLTYGIPTARLEFLRNVPMFEGLQDETLARLDSQLDEVEVASGRVLTTEGGAAGEAFIIETGTAEVSIGGEVISKTAVGEMIGELGVINHTPRAATVVAVTPMRLLAIHPSQMSWLFENPVLAKRIEQNLAKHTANAD